MKIVLDFMQIMSIIYSEEYTEDIIHTSIYTYQYTHKERATI